MFKFFITLVFALLFSLFGCVDTQGITDASNYLEQMAEASRVDTVICEPADSIPMGAQAACAGFVIANGRELAIRDQSILIWSATPDSVATVDLDGVVTARGPGTVAITAQGPRNSSAHTFLVVH